MGNEMGGVFEWRRKRGVDELSISELFMHGELE
jgi:hypothetical protein